MKNLLLILVTISILSCTKKQDDPKPIVTTTQKQSTPTSSCNKDSSWTRTTPTLTNSLYTFKETCTDITITWKLAGITLTVLKPTGLQGVSNYKSLTEYDNDSNPKKVYYYLYLGESKGKNIIIYEVKEAGRNGVGGAGMYY